MLLTRIKKDEVLELSYRWRLTILLTELLRTENYNVYTLVKLRKIKESISDMSQSDMAAHIEELNPKSRDLGATDSEISFYKKLKSVSINRFEILRLIKHKGTEDISDDLKVSILRTLDYKVLTISDIQVSLILYYRLINQMLPNQTEHLTTYLNDSPPLPLPMALSNQLFGFLTLYINSKQIKVDEILKVLSLQKRYSLWFDDSGHLTVDTSVNTNTLIKLINWVPTTTLGFYTLLTELSSVKKYVIPKNVIKLERGVYGNRRI